MQEKYFPSSRDIETYGAGVKEINHILSLECGGRPFSGAIYTFDPYENRPWQECRSFTAEPERRRAPQSKGRPCLTKA